VNQESLVKMELPDRKEQKENVASMHDLEDLENLVNQESLVNLENLVSQENLVKKDKKERQLDWKSLRIRLRATSAPLMKNCKTAVPKIREDLIMERKKEQLITLVLVHLMERYLYQYACINK